MDNLIKKLIISRVPNIGSTALEDYERTFTHQEKTEKEAILKKWFLTEEEAVVQVLLPRILIWWDTIEQNKIDAFLYFLNKWNLNREEAWELAELGILDNKTLNEEQNKRIDYLCKKL